MNHFLLLFIFNLHISFGKKKEGSSCIQGRLGFREIWNSTAEEGHSVGQKFLFHFISINSHLWARQR